MKTSNFNKVPKLYTDETICEILLNITNEEQGE